jgi:hypothetical protein
MNSSDKNKLRGQWMETGRVIAHAMNEVNIQKEKNMAKADKRKATMLENAAEKALSGKDY